MCSCCTMFPTICNLSSNGVLDVVMVLISFTDMLILKFFAVLLKSCNDFSVITYLAGYCWFTIQKNKCKVCEDNLIHNNNTFHYRIWFQSYQKFESWQIVLSQKRYRMNCNFLCIQSAPCAHLWINNWKKCSCKLRKTIWLHCCVHLWLLLHSYLSWCSAI